MPATKQGEHASKNRRSEGISFDFSEGASRGEGGTSLMPVKGNDLVSGLPPRGIITSTKVVRPEEGAGKTLPPATVPKRRVASCADRGEKNLFQKRGKIRPARRFEQKRRDC